MLLAERTCVITGAASRRGIGRATAELFAEHGARVAVLDLEEAAPREAVAAIGPEHRGYACDVRSKAACEDVAARVAEELGPIDVLVNNAGVSRPHRIAEIGPEEFDEVIDVNLRGTLYMSQAVLPGMRERRAGAIVCIASIAGEQGGGIFGGAHYAASKAGVMGLAKAMGRELGPEGIRVNTVCPGVVDTDIFGGQMTPERLEKIRAGIPMGRIGQPRDIAGACLYLASDLSGFVTGAVFDVNGGALIH